MNRLAAQICSVFVVLTLATLFAGCGGSDAPRATHTVEEEDDRRVISNTNAPVWEDPSEAPIRFEQTGSFGAEDAPPEALLSEVADIAVDDNGNVYVLDRNDSRLVAFDADGGFRWAAGREGQGPGEFQFPSGLVLGPNGELLVLQMSGRLDVWSADGTYERSHTPDNMQVRLGSLVKGTEATAAIVGVDEQFEGLAQIISTETFEVMHTFPVDVRMNFPLAYGPIMRARYKNDVLYVARRSGYQIDTYDVTTGERIQQITQPDAAGMVGMGMGQIEQGTRFYQFSALGAPLYLSGGTRLVSTFRAEGVDDPNEWVQERADELGTVEHHAFLDVYDEDYRLQGRLMWSATRTPGIGQLATIGPDGALYTTRTDPYPHVRRYTVSVE